MSFLIMLSAMTCAPEEIVTISIPKRILVEAASQLEQPNVNIEQDEPTTVSEIMLDWFIRFVGLTTIYVMAGVCLWKVLSFVDNQLKRLRW